MKYFQKIVITIERELTEPFLNLIYMTEPQGFEETDFGFLIYYQTKEESARAKDVFSRFEGEFILDEESVEDRNWNEEWEKSLETIRISDNLVITQSFNQYQRTGDELVIQIDPKMSFGTGSHETTRLILGQLESVQLHSRKVLDVGTGTGILAIAAVMLGAEQALGIDNDEWCLLNGTENVQLNHVTDKVEIRLAEVGDIEHTQFDIVIANIQRNVLLDIAHELYFRTAKGGRIILSGLLHTDEEMIEKAYSEQGLKRESLTRMNEWICIVYCKA